MGAGLSSCCGHPVLWARGMRRTGLGSGGRVPGLFEHAREHLGREHVAAARGAVRVVVPGGHLPARAARGGVCPEILLR